MMTRRRGFRVRPEGPRWWLLTPAMGVTFSACKNNHSGKVRSGSITTRAATCKSKETSSETRGVPPMNGARAPVKGEGGVV